MIRFINFLKYLFTTNIVDIEITFLHVFIISITLIWSVILFFFCRYRLLHPFLIFILTLKLFLLC